MISSVSVSQAVDLQGSSTSAVVSAKEQMKTMYLTRTLCATALSILQISRRRALFGKRALVAQASLVTG